MELMLCFNKIIINVEFIIDLFEMCGIQVDLLDGFYFCIEIEDFDNIFFEVFLENFLGEFIEYFICVFICLIGGDLFGDFWFQLVGMLFFSLEVL